MRRDERPATATVEAAREGDRKALDTLIAECLPLVYNVVGRAVDRHEDVDDVIQETMLRIVSGLVGPGGLDGPDGLRDPAGFRSWLVAVAMRHVRDRPRVRRAQPGFEPAALAGFVDLTVLRLGLTGQLAEVAEATRWLEPEDRDVLSLWWLEATGELTRAELAAGCGLTPQHAAVRVQRMKARLDVARGVVRALTASPRCGALAEITASWNGLPSALWRKRIARHCRECPPCSRRWDGLVPAEGLLAGLGLVPLPVGYPAAAALSGSAAFGRACPQSPDGPKDLPVRRLRTNRPPDGPGEPAWSPHTAGVTAVPRTP